MSLPIATKVQMDAMEKNYKKLIEKDGVPVLEEQPVVVAPVQELQEQDEVEEQEEQVYEEVEDQVLELEDVAQAAPVSKKESNIRDLRLKAERAEQERMRADRAERERDEMMKYMMSMQQPQKQQIQPAVEQDSLDRFSMDDESLVEGKVIKDLVSEIRNLKSMVKGYEQKHQRTDEQTIEMRLRSQYPDINKVLTQDNIDQFAQINPDLAETIGQTKDKFKQAKLAYEMIKQYGIYQEETMLQDKLQAKKNSVKPRPLTSISPTQADTPMSKVNSFANAPLTTELKNQLRKEMEEAIKGR